MNTIKWIGVGFGALLGVTVVMLLRSARGSSSREGGESSTLPGVDRSEAESLTPDWTEEDFRDLARIAKSYQANPADVLLVMTSESGLKPYAANRNSEGYPVAVGLLQFTSAANGPSGIGVSEGERIEILDRTVAEQMPLVDRFFEINPWTRTGRPYDSAGTVYGSVFGPSRLVSRGTSPDTVLYTEEDDPAAYKGNPGFDLEKKGYITVGDLIRHLRVVAGRPEYLAGLQRLRDATGQTDMTPGLPS